MYSSYDKKTKYDSRLVKRAINCLVAMTLLVCVVMGCGRKTQTPADTETTDIAATVNDATDTTAVNTEVTTAPDTSTATSSLVITALKAGAADSFILLTENNVTVIDTGLDDKADKLVEFLEDQGVTKIDELIITHFDKDHVGGADQVLENFEVGTVYTTYHSKESDDISEYLSALEAKALSETTVTEQISWTADGVTYTIYPPEKTNYADSESNNSSLVVRVVNGENSMLFAGDAEYERISELLQTEGIQSTILKMPHHGRADSNTNELIDWVSPEYAIITSSKAEPEDQIVLDMLETRGVTTYLTRDGNITIIMDESGVTVNQ